METPPTPSETQQGQGGPNETRAMLARRLQESAAVAIQRLRDLPEITTTWSLAAQAFPQATLVMAACLVSGSDVQLRTIQLDIPIEGINTPRSSLNALLEYSSIMGRSAFDEAEIGMGKLGSMAIRAQRQVDNIMYFIGRGPEASTSLQEEMKAFQELAARLPGIITEIETPFAKWYNFTDELRLHLSNRLGSEADDMPGDRELAIAEDEFQKAHQEAEQAEAYYNEQQANLAKCIATEIPKAASPDDLLKRLSKILREENSKWPGLSKLLRVIWEGSKTDDETFDERLAKHMKNLSQALEIGASDSNNERLSLQQRMETAKRDVERAGDALQAARQKRALALRHLGSLQISHDIARKNLELLREHEIDLKTIQRVLWDSTQQLRILRSQIGQLSKFFKKLSNVVESTVSEYFNSFKRSIQMGQPLSSEEAVRYNTLDKRRLLDDIYDIHGQLCTMSNISNVYTYISTTYIRAGLDRIESLDRTDIEVYKKQQRELEIWCTTATKEIEELTKIRSQKIAVDLETQIKMVLTAAIDQSQFWAS